MNLRSILWPTMLSVACTSAPVANAPTAPPVPGVPNSTASTSPLPGTSVWQLDGMWTDQHGVARNLASLRGRPRVLAMIYTSCQGACPRIVADMKRIESTLGDQADAVGFVLASVDPDHDSVEQLAAFEKDSQLDDARWTLLRAPEADVRELAIAIGMRVQKLGPTDFAHSNLITVLDAEGRVVHQQEGLDADPSPLLGALRAAITSGQPATP